MCDPERCKKEMLPRSEYNITKAVYCDVKCCFEDLCNVGKLTLPEKPGELKLSKAEVSLSSCLNVMSLAFIGFILGNN